MIFEYESSLDIIIRVGLEALFLIDDLGVFEPLELLDDVGDGVLSVHLVVAGAHVGCVIGLLLLTNN